MLIPVLLLTSSIAVLSSARPKTAGSHAPAVVKTVAVKPAAAVRAAQMAAIYDGLQLNAMGLSEGAFFSAVEGLRLLIEEGKLQNDSIISIVDFSLPSTEKRLFIIDLYHQRLLFNTLVSHGRNSGENTATSFSNKPNSFKSSLGFYITGDTYAGKHGLSMRLLGEERGINDNALRRGIVMHSADYVNDEMARNSGRIGRSEGCPAVPAEVSDEIINTISNGSCLFIYSPNPSYVKHSRYMPRA
ncbi:MAG TPA: murein L,D-transpeptidase catalytic domain family protein [Chitinophaga sp.]